MPELGESVHEGTLSRWLKKVGDYVKEDEPVVEIMTDKVNTELQAPASGVLVQILIQEGEPVEVFKAMGLIDESLTAADAGKVAAPPAAATAEAAPPAKTPEPTIQATTEPLSTPAVSGHRKWFTPVVRKLAKEHSISDGELESIHGSGTGARVTKQDVLAYLERRAEGYAPAPTIAPKAQPAPPAPKAAAPSVAGPEQELVPLVGMRKMIAEHMVKSAAIPSVSTLTEVDVTPMVKFRELNKDSFAATYGVKLTYTPFFIKALADALLEFPLVNSSLREDNQIVMNRVVHLGIAVSLGSKGDEGLIVPVIRNVERKGLIDLAKELEEIAAKARSNKLQVNDVQGATFTLTNPGSYGAVLGTPMLSAPQAGILGTYGIKKVPMIVDDMIAVRSVMNLVLTYDHRLVDGLLAGRFLQFFKAKLEKFDFFQ